jgi:hypothetical protein
MGLETIKKFRKNAKHKLAECINRKQQLNPFQHGMARTRVADGIYGLQIQRVDGNILNKQWRTAKGVALQLGGCTRD